MGRWIALLAGLFGGVLGIWKRPPILAVFAVNLIPVIGVLWFGWSPLAMLLLYWAENVFVGIFNALKLRDYERNGKGEAGPFSLSGFFVIHYGIFTLVHGVFAIVIGTMFMSGDPAQTAGVGLEGGTGDLMSYAAALAAILTLHLVDYLSWRFSKGWERGSAGAQMFAPYGRILVMHLTVLGGAAALAATHAPAAYIALLGVLKTLIETGWTTLSEKQADGSLKGMTITINGRSRTIQ